jgi:hypothetical protein
MLIAEVSLYLSGFLALFFALVHSAPLIILKFKREWGSER